MRYSAFGSGRVAEGGAVSGARSQLIDVGVDTVPLVELASIVETRPGVRSGRPCFVGTRIAVHDVLEYLASGMTAEELVADLPELTVEHVRAALEFAALRERGARFGMKG